MTTKKKCKSRKLIAGRKTPAEVLSKSGSSDFRISRLEQKLSQLESQNRILQARRDGIPWERPPITIVEPGDKPTHFYVINGDTGQGLDTEGRQWVAREMASKIYAEDYAIIFANRAYIHDPSINIFIEIHRAPRAVSVKDFR